MLLAGAGMLVATLTALQTADMDALLEGVTHVFHLAAQAGVRKSWGADFQIYTTNNIDGTQRLLEHVAPRKIEKLVYASSSSVYGDNVQIPMTENALPQPVSPYGVSKLAAEQKIPRPDAWKDLVEPVYKNHIVMPNPTSSDTGFLSVAGWIQTFGETGGWDFMDLLHENVSSYLHSGAKTCAAVAAARSGGVAAKIATLAARGTADWWWLRSWASAWP